MRRRLEHRSRRPFCHVNRWGRVACRTAVIIPIVLLGCCGIAKADERRDQAVEYNRDVRPILVENCFQCHGPDSASREAGLRLDHKAAAFAERDGSRAITPGKPTKSQVYQRIISSDDDKRMPPVDSGKTLSKQQVDILRRWIAQGAKYQAHWSFIAPQRPQPPSTSRARWVKIRSMRSCCPD
jgi:mono/diheme cytochrome c family protein